MEVLRIAAFSHNNQGGNPAGVVICNEMPTETKMLQTAKHVGYSETAFLKQVNDGWKIRYYAPETEVSFCGHATIASGAVLGELYGENTYKLYLNQGEISVTVSRSEAGVFSAALQSPNTWSKIAPQEYVEKLLDNEYYRLRLLEKAFDKKTKRILRDAGLNEGWKCLEIGPGAGSILKWMAGIVSDTGIVVGLDKNIKLILNCIWSLETLVLLKLCRHLQKH